MWSLTNPFCCVRWALEGDILGHGPHLEESVTTVLDNSGQLCMIGIKAVERSGKKKSSSCVMI